jgi:hypothetical protein
MNWKNGMLFVVGAVLISGSLLLTNREPALGQGGKGGGGGGGGGGPRYTVVETQGHNLLVTDNQKNMVYFYTVDKDEKVGADLKLRASVDLTQVGTDVIKINKAAK